MFLLRPTPGFAEPHLCTLHDLRTVYTLDDLMDFHEILDLREALAVKGEERRAAERARSRRGR